MKTFVINLLRRKDRLDSFLKTSPFKHVEIFEGIDHQTFNQYNSKIKNIINILKHSDYNRGEKGCFTSHYLLWKKIVNDNLEQALILEDDIFYCSNFKNKFDQVIKELETIQTFKILYIGGRHKKNHITKNAIKITKHIVKHDFSNGWDENDMSRGTFAYILSKEGAQFLLDKFEEQKRYIIIGVDHFMINCFKNSGEDIYNAQPLLCHADPASKDSDVKIRWI